jgi:hypothetical protein
MICPYCKEAGQTSRVFPQGGSRTLMYCQPFYDEQGKHHSHDSNITKAMYKCSNGHIWDVTTRGSCWCGWSGGETKVELLE